ncbi:MAG: ABC transporter substrate-binding protein [Lachnospiraceae bacterium]|nr:ABC transporter substrate-binding protein [Lachnospiraceae bacterium]
MKKIILAVISITVLAFSLFGCGSQKIEEETSASNDSTASADNDEIIKIGYSAWTGWYPWAIADEMGFFEKEGVNAETVYFPVYSDQFQAYSSGNLDLVSISLCDMVPPVSSGVDVVGFLVNDNSYGGDCLMATNGITKLEDLKGKTIAVEIGCLSHYLALHAIESVGLTENDVTFTNMTMADASTALISGQIDAAQICEPYVSTAEKEGNVTKLFSTKETPGLIPDMTATSSTFMKEHKDDLIKITKAWYDAMDYIQNHRDEAVKIMAEKAGTSDDEFNTMLDGIKLFSVEDNLTAFEKGDDYTSLSYTLGENAKFLNDQKVVDDISMIDDSLLDASIVEEIGKSK